MFIRNDDGSDPGIICEECYRSHYYGKDPYTKAYKHCILSETITAEISRKLCACQRIIDASNDESLFPISWPEGHTGYGSNIKDKCKLLQLGDAVAEAKYLGLQSSVGAKPRSRKDIEKSNWKARVEEQQKNRYTWSYGYTSSKKGDVSDFEDEEEPKSKNDSGPRGGRLKMMKTVQETSLHANDRSPTSTSVSVAEEAAEDGDIPLFFRKYVEKYPYGNVHMALRVGPIVIENGVAQ